MGERIPRERDQLSNPIRAFVHVAEAWYAASAASPHTIDEITVGIYHEDGGTTGEFDIRWTKVGHNVVPRLEAFDDSWAALMQFKDLLEAMSLIDNQGITPMAFCGLLKSLGISDKTPRKNVQDRILSMESPQPQGGSIPSRLPRSGEGYGSNP